MFRFFKNIFNAIIIVLVVLGLNSLYSNHFFDNFIENTSNFIKEHNEKTVQKVGDFSRINPEFNVDTAVNLFGFKAVLAEHKASSQRMIIIDSGRKQLLTQDDLKGSGIEEKLEELSKKFKYQSSNVSEIKIVSRGSMYAYGENLPYVKFTAKVTRLPISHITGIISVYDKNPKEQRLLLSVNEKNRYSQLIASEFYKSVRESK